MLGIALPVWAAERPGAISGYVRNASGTPQMGAVVEVLGVFPYTLTRLDTTSPMIFFPACIA